MGNVYSAATGGVVEKGHNLKLVLSVLPVVGYLSKRLADQTNKRDKRYGYLVNIQTSASILTAHLEEIQDGDTDLFEPQINKLANCLEEIFSGQVIKLTKQKASQHPRLHAIQEIISTGEDWEPNMKDLFDSSTLDSWKKLQRNLKSLTDELQPYGDNVDETEEPNLPTISQEPDDEVCSFVNRVLDAILCSCNSKSQRELRLRIGTYKKGKSKPRPQSLCVLLAQDNPLLQWHELLIHNQPERKQKAKSAKAVDPISGTGYGHLDGFKSTSCICSYLKAHARPDFLRLDVILDQDNLYPSSQPPYKRIFEPESLQEQIDLKTLLSFKDKPWTEPSKWALAVILAYSLLYLCCGSQVKGRWKRENIFFFKDGTHIPLQPFLGAPESCEGATDNTIKFHRHPEILELGVILLEIHLGQRLESFLKIDRDITTDNEFYWSAWEVYRKEEHQIISLVYRKAIEACLTPATFGTDSDVQKLRSVLFQRVVRPLEEELARNCQELLDPDKLDEEAAEKCDLALSLISSNRRSTNSSRLVLRRQDDLYATSNALLLLHAADHAKADQPRVGRKIDANDPELFGKEENQGNDVVRRKRGVRWADEPPAGELDEYYSAAARADRGSRSESQSWFLAGSLGPATMQSYPMLPPCPSRPADRRAFEIAVICALPLEADAVEALFDRHWDEEGPPYDKAPGDPNAYSAGALGRHNVVLAHMPGMGTTSAAAVATNCRTSFPNIRLALVVGVCGGVPFSPDGQEIILGDVVVSDGVVQYDLGRRLPDQFQRKDTLVDSLGRSNTEIRALLAKLKGLRNRRNMQKKTAEYLDMLRREPELAADYRGAAYDRLFEATYRHADQDVSCEQAGCDGKLVPRVRLRSTEADPRPVIHFGLMASGNTVIKSGQDRDEIARAENVIAFEMEGAGVWDAFPCVVIKGVCDYADSHKNKGWQRYAAAAAAACAKAFLDYWVPSSETYSWV